MRELVDGGVFTVTCGEMTMGAFARRLTAVGLALSLTGCGTGYPWPKAPSGGPIVDGPYKDCLYANGYTAAFDMDGLDRNDRALDRCEGVPFDY